MNSITGCYCFSGKSTYCKAIAHHLSSVIKRKVIIVNLDPANDKPPYNADVDVQNIIEVDEVSSVNHNISYTYHIIII